MARYLSLTTAFLSITAPVLLFLVSAPTAVYAVYITETFYSYNGVSNIPASTVVEIYTTQTPSGNTILRPSAGETVTAGSPYTITWTDIVGSDVQFNLQDSAGNAILWGSECDGWLIYAYCAKLSNETANTGSWVWNVPLPPADDFSFGIGWNEYLKEYPQTFWLELNVVTPQNPVWQSGSPFQDSQNFSIVVPGGAASSSTSTLSETGIISASPTPSSEPTSGTLTTGELKTTTAGTASTGTLGAVAATPTSAASLKGGPDFWSVWIIIAVAHIF